MASQASSEPSPKPNVRARRWLRVAACSLTVVGLVAYAAKLAHLHFRSKTYWFQPAGPEVGDWEDRRLGQEDVWLESEDGIRLHAWYVPCPAATSIVLLLHGSGGNLAEEVGVLEMLRDVVHASTLIVDYRGYGKSGGTLGAEQDFYRDALAARRWLERRAGVGPEGIVLIGRSLGSGIAIELGARDGARALVIQSGFPSLRAVAAHHYWWAPIHRWMRYPFDSRAKIARFHGPVLVSHGTDDDVVPLALARELFEAANPPKELLILPGHTHFTAEPREYYETLRDFLARAPGGATVSQDSPRPGQPPNEDVTDEKAGDDPQ